MKIHKATSAKGILTECGLLIWNRNRERPYLPSRLRWSKAITCKNCLRTRPK